MYEKIKQFLMTSFHVAEADFTPGATITDLGLDSLELVELSMEIEAWGVRVSDDELIALQRLDAIVQHLEARSAVPVTR